MLLIVPVPPDEMKTLVPVQLAPSYNHTLPVAVDGDTATVKVMVCPNAAGLVDVLSVVVVPIAAAAGDASSNTTGPVVASATIAAVTSRTNRLRTANRVD